MRSRFLKTLIGTAGSAAHALSLAVVFFLFPGPFGGAIAQSQAGSGSTANDTGQAGSIAVQREVEIIPFCAGGEAEDTLRVIEENNLPGRPQALFLLGEIYRQRGMLDDAESYLTRAAADFPLLKEYALAALTRIYMAREEFPSAVETAREIKNRVLLRQAKQDEIDALLALESNEAAEDAIDAYLRRYPADWDYRMKYARVKKALGRNEEAVTQFRKIYVDATPLSSDAFEELRMLGAEDLTETHILEHADNLLSKFNYRRAEEQYLRALTRIDEAERNEVMFRLGMSQFRQKKYSDSADVFGGLSTAEASYWKARSLYRLNDNDGFQKALEQFEERHPRHRRLPLLYLMSANELRREGDRDEAERLYQLVYDRFASHREDALWGLAWLHYTADRFNEALKSLEELATYTRSHDYMKYLFWKGKAHEKVAIMCADAGVNDGGAECAAADPFSGLPHDETYYGYRIRMSSGDMTRPESVPPTIAPKPEGETYDRIEALTLLNMKKEAVNEIRHVMRDARGGDEYFYLANLAIGLGEYKPVVARAEPRMEKVFLPYSYPRAYWSQVERAAGEEGLDPYLILAVMREESRYEASVVSWAGAVGLMQIMPGTGARLVKSLNPRSPAELDLYNAEQNIRLGSHYLAQLIEEFEELPLVLAAYNAGERVVRRWIERFGVDDMDVFVENIPYRETRRYVQKVLKSLWQYRSVNGLHPQGAPVKTSPADEERQLLS